jgi:hypothetical protein
MSRPLVSRIACLEQVKAAYPHYTNEELAAQFGLTRRQLTNIASTHGLLKTHETLSRARSVRKTLLAVAPWTKQLLDGIAAAGPAGVDFAQARRIASTANEDQARATLNKLTAAGRIHRYAKHRVSRWFSTAEWATAHGARVLAPVPSAPGNGVQIKSSEPPAAQRGALVITASTRFTPCPGAPGPEARWHGDARPVFSSMPPGVYTDQASSWVKAVTAKP